MVPSGPPTPPVGGAQNISPSLLRNNSGILGTQGGSVPSQQPAFPSLISPRSQYGNMNLLGNMSNVSSLLNQSFGNGGSNSGISGSASLRGGMDMGAESDPLSGVGNNMSFTPASVSFVPSSTGNPGSSGQTSGPQFPNPSSNQMVSDQQRQSAQLEAHSFQRGQQSLQQLPLPNSHQQLQQQQQQQYQPLHGGVNHVVSVKMEPQMSNEQNVHQQQQQQQVQSFSAVKMEPQQLQPLRALVPVKTEPQLAEQSLFLQQQQQQQQQQQLLQISRQNPQATAAQINFLQQQRMLQFQQQQQQQQQQQMLKSLPQQRVQLPHQFQQSLPVRPATKPAYEPGTCARRLTHYMYHQQHRPPVSFLKLDMEFYIRV